MKSIILSILFFITPYVTYAGISHESKIALRLHKYTQALKLLKSQAVRENADAQYHLALLYRTGKGTKKVIRKLFTGLSDLPTMEMFVLNIIVVFCLNMVMV